MKKIVSFLIPIVMAVFSVVIINMFLDNQLQKLYQEKNISQLGGTYGNVAKDRSVLIKNEIAKQGDLFLMGSSELRFDYPQNSMNFFPFNGAEYNVSCYGRANVQNLQHTTALGSMTLDKNPKVAYIISTQWFFNKDGISPANFAANFSDIQFYKFINNPKINEENKKYYAKRVFDCLRGTKKYSAEVIYSRLYISNSIFKYPVMLAIKPYYKISEYLLNIKDKAMIYKELRKLPNKNINKTELRDINWSKEYSKVEEKINSTEFTNEFYNMVLLLT